MRHAATLAAALAAGATAAAPARAQVQAPEPAATKIAVDRPAPSVALRAQRLDATRLTAVVELAGRGAPGAELSLVGACGGLSCEGMTYADGAGRWRTRMRLTTPRGRRNVGVRISYWPGSSGQPPAHVRVVLRSSSRAAPAAPPVRPVAPGGPTGPAPSGARPALVVIGDSLAIGTARALAADLPGVDVRTDARVGRPLAEGIEVLSSTTLPWQVDGTRTILAFSLFTNDDPRDVPALEAAVRASVARLGPGGCAIWATVSRPAVGGTSYRAANARLQHLAADPRLAGRLLVVPWAREVARHRGWMARDRVHTTAAGAYARALIYAGAVRACGA